jgi:hypothetical protein
MAQAIMEVHQLEARARPGVEDRLHAHVIVIAADGESVIYRIRADESQLNPPASLISDLAAMVPSVQSSVGIVGFTG